MTAVVYSSRRIFKSAITSQKVLRELLQMLFLSELLDPSEEVWFVSPWISDVVLLDNRAGSFDSINPDWRGREVRLSDIVIHLLSSGGRANVITRSDEHNLTFVQRLRDRAHESVVDDALNLIVRDQLHTKGVLLRTGLLLGSMNLTYNGLVLNDEFIEYDTTPSSIASARLAFQSYRNDSLQ